MEGKTNQHFDGIFQKLKEPRVQRKVMRFGALTVVLFTLAALISNSVFPQTILGEAGSASANRLWSSGAELNTTSTDVEVTGTSGTMSISSSTVRSGNYAYRANPTSSTGTFYKTWAASAQSNKFWFRQYIKIATAPGADTYIMQIGNGASGKIGVYLTSSSTLQLRNEEDSTSIGSASSTLSTGTWYRVELFVDTTTLSSTDTTLLLDGTSVASSTSENLASGINRWTWGVATSTTADVFFDDLAVNDSSGRTANNWPGDGKIVHMQPDATGSNSAWSNTYTSINAATWTNDSTFIYSQSNNQIEDVNLESASSAGISSGDRVKFVSVGARVRTCGNSGGGGPGCFSGFGSDVNYATRITAGGSTDETQVGLPDNDTTTFYTNDNDQPKLNATTSYDLPGSSTTPWTASDLDSIEIGVKNYDSTGLGFRVSLLWLQVEYVASSGGRVFSSGFELQSAAAGMEYTANIGTTPTVDTTNERSGAAALRTNASAGTSGWEYDFESANTAADYYFRIYIRIATAPGTLTNVMEFYDSANSVQASIRMNTDRTLELWNDEDNIQIGSDSSAIALTTWTRLEMRLDCGSTCAGAGSATLDARINGSSFASSSTVNHANGVMTIRAGVLTSTTADFSWDDVALNQAIGTSQNSWPDDGKILYLRPSADDGTNTAWTNGFANVDETTPDDATTLVSETTSGDIDDYDLDASTLSASDTINLVSVGVRFRTSSATQEDFRVRIKDASAGTAIEGNTLSPASTTWTTNATASPKNSPLTAYTRPNSSTAWTNTELDTAQIGVRDVLSGSGTVQVTAIWLLVDYSQAIISVSGTCDQYDQATDCTDDGSNEIAIAVNGSVAAQVDTVVDGAWTVTGVSEPSSGDIITVFINGETTDSEEAVAVTKYDGTGDITGIVLYHRHLTIGSDDNQTITNTDLANYDNSVSSDEDIFFDVSAGNDLTVDSLGSYTDEELYVVSGNTFRPASGGGADVTTTDVEIDGTWTADSNSISVSGDWQNDGVFTAGTSAVTFNSTSSGRTLSGTMTGGSAFNDVIFNGASGGWTLGAAISVSNFDITNGTFDTSSGNNYSVTVSNDLTGNSGTWTLEMRNSTWTVSGNWNTSAVTTDYSSISEGNSNLIMDGSGTKTISTGSNQPWLARFYNLTFGQSGNTTQLATTLSYVNTLTLGTGTIDLNSKTLYNQSASTATPLSLDPSGTWGTGNGNFVMWGTGSQTLPAFTYNSSVTNEMNGGSVITLGTGTTTITGNLSMGCCGRASELSTGNQTLNINGNLTWSNNVAILNAGSSTINVGGNWVNTNDGVFNAGTSTVVLNGSSQQSVSGSASGADAFYNLTITNNSGTSASDCERTGFTASVDFGGNVEATNNYTITTANVRVEYNSGSTYTFNNINWNGQATGTKIYFRNSLTSGAWLINVSGTQTAVSYVNVSRSDASGGNQIVASDGTNVDCSNNTNWLFNTAPDSPTSLTQKRVTAGTTMSVGDWTNETQVLFEATATDTDNPDTLQLCVEKDILGVAFSNTEDSCGTGVAYSGSGVTVAVTISSQTDASEYHWQARVKDAAGSYSSWVSFGANAESARDYGIDSTACTYGSSIYDGTSEDVDAPYNDGSLVSLSANWDAFTCTVSGLDKYEYSVGTTVGGTDIKTWTDNSTTESITATGLVLRTNQKYYVNVRATDNAANVSSVYTSDGQDVLPEISMSIGASSITFATLNAGNDRSDTKTLTTTTSTNGYGGYVIRQYVSGLLSSGSTTVPMFSAGSYASPASWPSGACSGTTCGYGYTSNDTTIQGANKFGTGTLYAPFSTSAFGDIVADHTTAVDGSTGKVVNEQFTITHKVAVNTLQEALSYSSTVYYIATGTF